MIETIQKFLATGKSQSEIARELGVSRQLISQYLRKSGPVKPGAKCKSCGTLLTKENRSAGLSYSHLICKTCLNGMQIKNKYRQMPVEELERLKTKWVRLLALAEEVLSERVGDGH